MIPLILCQLVPHSSVVAQTYDWLSWTYANGTATARIGGAGAISVTVAGSGNLGLSDMRLRFDNVAFTPADAPSVGTGQYASGVWTVRVELAALPATGGLLIGFGNFGYGHSALPGYRLAAFDRAGNEIPLSSFHEVGSYDHTWTSSGHSFNDDVRLNVTNGNFEVTTVSGSDNNNSDMLLLSLPPSVGHLLISSLGTTSGDTVNVVAALPHLNVSRSGSDVTVRWASPTTNLVLEATPSLSPPSWAAVTNAPVVLDGSMSVTNLMSADARIFRLKLQ